MTLKLFQNEIMIVMREEHILEDTQGPQDP